MAFPSSETVGPKADVINRFCVGCEVTICEFVVQVADTFDNPNLSAGQRDQQLARSAELIPDDCPQGEPLINVMRTPVAEN
jgi:hypothetical protein